jgi:PhnB protein
MKIAPYLLFPGTCREAFSTYETVLRGKLLAMTTHAGTPAEEHVAPEWRDKIIHACLEIDGQMIMASDSPPDRGGATMRDTFVSLSVTEVAEAERIFAGLSEGADIRMPLAETFWSPRFGMLVDRFGTHWMIGVEPARPDA